MYDCIDFLYFWLAFEIVYLAVNFRSIISGNHFKRDRLHIAPAAISAGIGATVGLAQMGVGIAQKIKAAKLAKSNVRPELKDNPYVQDAYDITASNAQKGLSAASMQAYNTNNDRNLSSSINAILKSGGSANNIADLYEGSQTGLRSLALANQEAQMRNFSQFLESGLKPMADQEREQWYLNEYVPYQDKAALAASLSEQGMQNIFKGINTAGGAAAGYAGSKMYDAQNKTVRGEVPGASLYSSNVAGPVGMFSGPNTRGIALPSAPSASTTPFMLNPEMRRDFSSYSDYNGNIRQPGPARFINGRWE